MRHNYFLLKTAFPTDGWCMENTGINSALNDMIERGQLSQRKLDELIRLKSIVDGYAKTAYVSGEEAELLKERYGAYPDIRTWGDYFQCEIAAQFFDLEEQAFAKIVDTVRFDLISAIMIFHEKKESFFQMVEEEAIAAHAISREEWGQKEEEWVQLQILSRYYQEMGLAQAEVSSMDRQWFDSFLADRGSVAG